MRPALLPVNQHLTPLLCPIPHPRWTSHPSVPSTRFSIVDPGMMVPVAGLWVDVGIVMSANDAMVNTPLPTAPSSLQRALALPVPHFIRGKTPSALTTRFPCRWLESILEVSGRLLSNRYLIKGGSIRLRLRVWPLGARASPSHESLIRALELWLGGPFGLVWGLMAVLHSCASHGGISSI